MATKNFCDRCKKEIESKEHYRMFLRLPNIHYAGLGAPPFPEGYKPYDLCSVCSGIVERILKGDGEIEFEHQEDP